MKRDKERGGVTIIVMAAMVAVLGLGAVVVDGGLLYHNHARLQSAVDVAALAGARVLAAGGSAQAVTQAMSVAQANGLALQEVQVTVNVLNSSVTVGARRDVALGLARVLGQPRADVVVSATAAGQSIGALRGAVPLGVVWREFTFGQVYDLKVGGGDGEEGWYGAVDLGLKGGGAADYREHLRHGWEGLLRVGDDVPLKTGNMSGPTRDAIRDRLERCNHLPRCTYQLHAAQCSRLLIVPVVTPPHHGSVEVVGFAGFFVDSLPGSGNESTIRGRFIEFVGVGEAGVGASFGARKFSLIN